MIDNEPDSAQSPEFPPLTAVLVVRDDMQTLEATLASITGQTYPAPIDIVIAVGRSSDGTEEFVRRFAAERGRVTVITSASPTVGLNEAIAAARTPLIIRVDARSILPADFAVKAVGAAARSDAAAIVGTARPTGTTPFERAEAHALTHRFGLGADPLAARQSEGPTRIPTAHIIRRRAFIDVGLYDEEIRHGQAWELNARLREAGRSVWFTPDLAYTFRPASSVVMMTRSSFAEGLWRGEFARAFPGEKDVRFILPPAVVIAVLLGFIVGAVGFFGVIAGAIGFAGIISTVLLFLLVVPLLYLLAVVALAVGVAVRESPQAGVWALAVFPLLHFTWGFGFISGYLNLEGAAGTVIVAYE